MHKENLLSPTHHLGEVLVGVATIRALEALSYF